MRLAFMVFISLALLAPLSGTAQATADAAPAETAAPHDELAVPSYIIPTRNFIVPQDEDLPRKDKRRWARPVARETPEAPPAATEAAPPVLPE